MAEYSKIPQKEYDKAIGQWRLQAGEILSVFNFYGMDIYIKGALAELEEITVQFSKRVRGVDAPIQLKSRRNARK